MAISDEQKIASAISDALASDDPAAAMSHLMAPGVSWSGPAQAEVREVEAREGGVIVGLRWPGASTEKVDRWHVLRIERGSIVDTADFGLRADALSHLARVT